MLQNLTIQVEKLAPQFGEVLRFRYRTFFRQVDFDPQMISFIKERLKPWTNL